MKLNDKAFVLAGAILWSFGIFVLTWLGILGYGALATEAMLKAYYVGYSMSPIGSLVGALYGFVDGGMWCFLFALLYNKFAEK